MNLSKSKIFLVLCLAFIFGVFLGRYLNYEIMAILAMIFIIIITLGWGKKLALVIGLAGLVALLGAWRFMSDFQQNDLAQFYGQKAQVEGVISGEPDERSDKTYLTLSHLVVNQIPVHSKLMVMALRFPEYEYGQKISFEAKIAEPKEYPDFSYKNYLSRFGVDAVVYQPKIDLATGNFGNPVKLGILRLKKHFVDNLAKILPEPQNSFLAGLLLGAKRSIPPELMDKFNATGVSHVVAISGYNITIIAWALDKLLHRFRKRISFGLSLAAIVIFVIMTGASASVIRAGVMGALVLIALNVGRVYAITNSLAFTAVVMLGINPQILHFDVGFQLSFVALLGLVYLIPLIDPYFLWFFSPLRPYLLATIAAQIFTLPILLLNFGRLSIVAVGVNVLILIMVPATMLSGFLTGLAGLIWLKLAIPFAWVSWVMLTYIIKVVEIFAVVPFAAVTWHANILVVIIYYLILGGFLFYHYQRDWAVKLLNLWKPRLKISFGG
jgi:competence protein ComEC